MDYDAILLISFGGPESPEDVMPFMENVLRGKNVPRERVLQVAEHYYHFGGKSPINNQNRRLLASLAAELAEYGPHLPIYWGNRNWHPLLADTLARMKADGVRRAVGFVTSAYSSYSNCRQYREDLARAQAEVGEGAPEVDKIRVFFNHPGFVEATADRVRCALEQIPAERRATAHLVFTAHSIPLGMAQLCDYAKQLRETSRLVGDMVHHHPWHLVYQSRSGPPSQPWLEPDVFSALRRIKAQGGSDDVVIAPIGFVSDHMEVIFDLDIQAREVCQELGMTMARAETVGTHPRFIRMLRELVAERMDPSLPRLAVGALEPRPDLCPQDCCLPPSRPR